MGIIWAAGAALGSRGEDGEEEGGGGGEVIYYDVYCNICMYVLGLRLLLSYC